MFPALYIGIIIYFLKQDGCIPLFPIVKDKLNYDIYGKEKFGSVFKDIISNSIFI